MFDIIVGAIIFDKDKRVLLVEENSKENKGLLNLPMGHLEKNESLIAGAKREVLEETGLNVKIKSLVDSKIFEHNNKDYISFVFKGDIESSKQLKSELRFSFYDFNFIKQNCNKLRNENLILSAIKSALEERSLLEILS